MKKRLILISGFLCLLLPRLAPAEDWHRTYDGLLQKYVTADGVKYKDWHATPEDRLALNQVIEGIARTLGTADQALLGRTPTTWRALPSTKQLAS